MKKLNFIILCNLFLIINIKAACIEKCPYGSVKDNGDCIECGIIPIEPNVKIVNGIEAKPHSYPSQALIFQHIIGTVKYINNEGIEVEQFVNKTYRCGGTIINRYTIMTASHCVQLTDYFDNTKTVVTLDPQIYPDREATVKVYLGVHNLEFVNNSNIPIPDTVQIFSVSKIIDHPNYDSDIIINDITLLILSKPIEFTPEIQPACLPNVKSSTYPDVNIDAYLSGWGMLFYNGPRPYELYNVKLTILETEVCDIVYHPIADWSKQICAGDKNGIKNACHGDSGGGLYIETIVGKKLKRVVTGIVSYGNGCGIQPGVYTRVSYYLDWIKQNWKL